MKRTIGNSSRLTTMVFTAFVCGMALLGSAGLAAGQQDPGNPPQTQGNQVGPPNDPIRQLNLTPEQAEKIRGIREQGKEERFAINQRLHQAQRALDDAIDSDNPSEALIEQRASALAEALAAATRMRALAEIRIRRVMTPEQLATLRALRQRAQNFREQRNNQVNNDQMKPRNRVQRRRDALQQDGNLRPNIGPPVRPNTVPLKQRP